MIRQPIRRRTSIILAVLSVLVLLGGYSALSARQKQKNPKDTTIPSWKQLADGSHRVFRAREKITYPGPDPVTGVERDPVTTTSFANSWFVRDTAATFGRLAAGLIAAAGISIVLGILMGCYRPVEALLLPPLSFFAKIPPTAMLAIFFVSVGTGFNLYLSLLIFGLVPTLTQSVHHAARHAVPEELVWKSFTLGASQLEIIWNVIARQTLPVVIDAVRLQVGPAMVYLIAAEWALADEGYGYTIRILSKQLDMSVVYIYLALLGAAGFAIDIGLRKLVRVVCPWYGTR